MLVLVFVMLVVAVWSVAAWPHCSLVRVVVVVVLQLARAMLVVVVLLLLVVAYQF